MKKTLLLLITLIGFITSCKTTSNTNCDAYGYKIESDEFDIHEINAKNNSKFVTTTNIKY
jgi:hypothetical protein